VEPPPGTRGVRPLVLRHAYSSCSRPALFPLASRPFASPPERVSSACWRGEGETRRNDQTIAVRSCRSYFRLVSCFKESAELRPETHHREDHPVRVTPFETRGACGKGGPLLPSARRAGHYRGAGRARSLGPTGSGCARL
jgi:hypothetical protein